MKLARQKLNELDRLLHKINGNNKVSFKPGKILTPEAQFGIYRAERIGEVIPWHTHVDSHEHFIVIKGKIRIEAKGNSPVVLSCQEHYLVPSGVEHRADILEYPFMMIFGTIPPEKAYAER